MANLAVVILLGLKNTPLSLFTLWSYERLNILHQVTGYTTLAFIIIHLSCYSSYFAEIGRMERLLAVEAIYGIVATAAFTVLVFSGAFIRRWWYELFYYLHGGFWILAIITTGLHQPDMSQNVIVITLVITIIWIVDRLIRLGRLAYNLRNTATLVPLPNGGTHVRMAMALRGAEAGKHCFLSIPSLRPFEAHPFTIVSTDPIEFVIASHNGFTSKLHEHAVRNPGICLRASIDGPYGRFPQLSGFDKLVLISGGSGASFTFGMALNLIKRQKGTVNLQIEFIWAVKKSCKLQVQN